MKWREWHDLIPLSQHLCVYYCRTLEPRATMDHAMAHTQHPRAAVLGAEPSSERIECFTAIVSRGVLIRDALAGCIFDTQARRRADAFDLTPRFQMPALTRRTFEDTKLQTRRSRVEYECIVVHQLCLLHDNE